MDQAALMLTLSGRVTETQQVLANQTTFRLRTPDLKIAVGSLSFSNGRTIFSRSNHLPVDSPGSTSQQPVGEAVVGKEMAAKITFTNPLPRMLKGVVFRVEGLGLQKGHEVDVG